MNFKNTLAFAQELDKEDPLKKFRDKFYIPLLYGKDSIYFNGNSLGLQPKTTQDAVLNEMEDWANYGGEGHLHARNPWITYHDMFPKKLAPILGALPEEIVVMNNLTVNLHLMLATFYRPAKERYKIICEEKAFPSDRYAVISHIQLAGYKEEDALIEVKARNGEFTIRIEDILSAIKDCGEKLALVIIGGVNYYTGQVFDMKRITSAAHETGAKCGFDLAHAVGNIELQLHDWDVDFSCWCTYKYLNSSPGGVGGAFVHQRYVTDKSFMRLAGWWGTNKETRFKMEKDFDPIPTAEGWLVSCTPVLSMAAHKAALEIFAQAGFKKIVEKGKRLSEYLLYILDDINEHSSKKMLEIITPRAENEHGCQVSVLVFENGKHVFDMLRKNSVIADWREPDVIRVAPVPLYNTFEEVYQFGEIIGNYLSAKN
ncbi:MAG: kynureninase [Ginsengibacter sp.]